MPNRSPEPRRAPAPRRRHPGALTRLPLSVVAALAIPLACSGGGDQSDFTATAADGGCPRGEPRELPAEAVVREPADGPPCRVVFLETGIVLRPDSAGERPDPGRRLAMDSRGRIYSSTPLGSEVAVWKPDGSFDRVIGRAGSGPGELAGTVLPYVDADDRLHVRDNAMYWSVFDADGQFLSRSPAQLMGGVPGFTHILDDGTVLTSGRDPSGSAPFRIVSLDGSVLRSFGGEKGGGASSAERTTSYAGGTRFVAAPAAGEGYVLELWDTDGRLVRRYRRDVRWYEDHLPAARDERQPSEVRMLQLDSTGVLLVGVRVNDRRWRWIEDRRERREKEVELYAMRVEAIDLRAGELLASELLDDGRDLPWPMVPRRPIGVLTESDADGLTSVKLVEVRLEPVGRTPE